MSKTIVIFAAFLPPHSGGIETYTEKISEEMVRQGHKVFVVTSNYDNLKDEEQKNGVNIYRVPIFAFWKQRYPIVKKNKSFHEIMGRIEWGKVDAIIVNTRFHTTSLIGATIGKKYQIPVYLIEHGSGPLTMDNTIIDLGLRCIENTLTRLIRNKITRFYGVSRAASGHLQRRYGILSSGEWYNSIVVDESYDGLKHSDVVVISYVGRVIKQKGVDTLLEAVVQLKNQHAVQVNIVGDGAYLAPLQQRYAADNIRFWGRLTQQEVAKIDQNTDIFVYAPHHPEGLPSSMLEAAMYHCAIITTRMGGTTEIVEDGVNGVVVDGTVQDMAKKLEMLVADKKQRQRYGHQARQTIEEKFSTTNVTKKIIDDISHGFGGRL